MEVVSYLGNTRSRATQRSATQPRLSETLISDTRRSRREGSTSKAGEGVANLQSRIAQVRGCKQHTTQQHLLEYLWPICTLTV